MFCKVSLSALVLTFCFLAACGDSPGRMPDSLVFVPFEYLGGSVSGAPDPNWIGPATSAIAARQTSSLALPAVREVHSYRLRHVVQGYVSGREGALTATATVRDEGKQTTMRSIQARGANVLELAASLAAQMVEKPKPYTTASSEAVRELFSGNIDAALAKDPKFGTAHLARVESLLRAGKAEEARAASAGARDANFTEGERAQFAALTAETPKARSAAMLAAARSARYDAALWMAAADAASTAKDFPIAIEAYQRAAEFGPENVGIWNSLAYAQGFAGDIDAAMQSLDQYQKLQPRDANVFDSKGEILMYHGRFKEAEQEFLRAFEMDNTRLGGGEAYRAALAAFLAGDRIKAESNFGRYLAFRKQNNDPILGLRESIWLYTTGRADQARNKAATVAAPAAKAQLALWDAVDGKGSIAFGDRPEFAGWKLLATGRYAEAVEFWRKRYDATPLTAGNDARVMLAVALHGAQQEQEAQALLDKWPLPPTGPEPGFSSVTFAKAIALKAGHR